MSIEFEKITNSNKEALLSLARWHNDDTINYLFIPNFQEKPYKKIPENDFRISDAQTNEHYMIKEDGKYIGDFSIDYNFDMLESKKEKVAWISVVICKESSKRKGIGSLAIDFMEKRAKSKGYTHIELGVFEYNIKAISFYEKKGYRRIKEIDNFTFYNNAWHKDFRYLKELE